MQGELPCISLAPVGMWMHPKPVEGTELAHVVCASCWVAWVWHPALGNVGVAPCSCSSKISTPGPNHITYKTLTQGPSPALQPFLHNRVRKLVGGQNQLVCCQRNHKIFYTEISTPGPSNMTHETLIKGPSPAWCSQQ